MVTALAAQDTRIAPLGWVLIVLRLALMLALLLVCAPLHLLWRLLGLRRFWPRVFLAGVGRIAGLHLTRRGKRVPGALLLSNHVSWHDIPALSHAANSAFVAHDGLSAHPFFKWLCEMNDTVFIARHNRASVGEQARAMREALADGGTLTLFPEGTTGDGTQLLPFKSALLGAMEPLPEGATVQPVLLEYADPLAVAWIGDEPGVDYFKRTLARMKPVRLTVHFFPPLSGPDVADRKAMIAAAHSALARQML